MAFNEEENRKRLLRMRDAGFSSGQYGQSYGYQIPQMNQPVQYNAFQQGSFHNQAAQSYGYQAPPMIQPVQYNAFHQNSFRHHAPQNAPTGPKNFVRNQGGYYAGGAGNRRYEPRSIPTRDYKGTPSASSQGENASPSGSTQMPIATASPYITAIAKPVGAASPSITADTNPIEAASTSITSPANPIPYQPFPDPEVPFFNKIGAYTLVLIEPSDFACSDCKRTAFRMRLCKGQVAKVLDGKKIPQEFEAICEHALQKKFDSACRSTRPAEQCHYCTISFYEYRQAQFIERITKICYIGKKGKERNFYVPPVDNLDEKHPHNWTAPAIPTTEESDVPTPVEHSQEVQDNESVSNIVPEAPEQCNVEVGEEEKQPEVIIVQQPLEHSDVESPSAPKKRLGLWLSFILLLGFLVSFTGFLRYVLQAGSTQPPVMSVNTTQSEWDYIYNPPISNVFILPTSPSSAEYQHLTTTSTATPTETFTQPAGPTPSPEPSSSTYDTIVGTASMAVGTPAKVAALVAGVSFVLGALRFGPSIVASFTE